MKVVTYNFKSEKFKAIDGDWLAKSIARNTYYDKEGLRFSSQFISRTSVVVDVGANIGNHSLFYLKECRCKYLHAFEPHPFMFGLLQFNLQRYANKKLYNKGLSDRSGKAKPSKINPRHVGSTTFTYDSNGNAKLERLDLYEIRSVDFIKIDVEGFEYEVLAGARDTISKHKPVIAVEVREHDAHSAGDSSVVLKETASSVHMILVDLGYKHIKTFRIGATQEFWESK